MLAIRFQRTGRTKQPFYRIVVSEKTKDMYGRHLEILGNYNPRSKELNIQEDKVKHWLGLGAQTSASVFNLLVSKGILAGKKMKAVSISNSRKAKQEENKKKEAASKAAAETPKEAVVEEISKEEAPKEESKPEQTK